MAKLAGPIRDGFDAGTDVWGDNKLKRVEAGVDDVVGEREGGELGLVILHA